MATPADLPRVAFVAGTLGRGGAERQLYYQLKALVAAGASPVVASLASDEHWEAPIRELGVEVLSFEREHSTIARVRALAWQLRKHRPQIVQSAHFYTNLYASAVARLLRVPEIGAIRSDTLWALRELGRAGTASLRVPRHLAINSRAALAQAAALGVHGARLSYLPNVVDVDAFAPSPMRKSQLSLLDVGRLEPVKRHDRFLRVVRRAVDELPQLDIRATIVGEGPDGPELMRQADSLGITDRVTFLTDAPMDRVYQSASMLVLTSDNEGTPNVVLEALSAALPVAAFSVGGVPEIITSDEVGLLIRPADEDAMAVAVIALCRDRALREEMGARARRYVEQSRSPDALARHLRTLYRRASPQRSVRRSTDRGRAA